jgi:hypothetical protein
MYSANSLVGNGMNDTNRSSSRLRRTKEASARSRYPVIALCPSQVAPMVEKLTT